MLDPANNADDRKTFYAQVKANMIGQRILVSITPKVKKSLMTREKVFKWMTADGQDTLDSLLILQIIVESIKPSTHVGISVLKDQICATWLAGHNYNVKDMCDHLHILYGKIKEQNGSHEDMVKDTFVAVLSGTNSEFNLHMNFLKNKWELGKDFTLDDVANAAITKYNNLDGAKSWQVPEKQMPSSLLLSPNLRSWKLPFLLSSCLGIANPKQGAGADKRSNIAEWHKKKSFGASVTRDNKSWWWCPRHKGSDYDRLYVTHKPENHGEHQRCYNKGDKADTSNGSSATGLLSSAGSGGKLVMKDYLKSAMVAKFGCTASDAEKLWSEVASQGNWMAQNVSMECG